MSATEGAESDGHSGIGSHLAQDDDQVAAQNQVADENIAPDGSQDDADNDSDDDDSMDEHSTGT